MTALSWSLNLLALAAMLYAARRAWKDAKWRERMERGE